MLCFRFEIHRFIGHEPDELVVIRIAQLEVVYIDTFPVFFIIQVREVFDIALSVKDIRETAVIIVGHANVGHHAAAVVHFAARFGRILLDQRIGYGPYAAVFGPMRIVDRLDAAPAGGVVFGSGEFQVGVVADRAG